MTAIALIGHQIRYTQLSYWRNRRSALMALAFPLMLLTIFAALNSGTTIKTRGGISYIDFYVPGIIAYAIMLICFSATALQFAGLRERGILKRVRTTPLPWAAYVAGVVGSTLITMALATGLLLAVGALAFGAHVPTRTLPGLIVTLALGSACLTMLGIAGAKLVASAESGMGILTIVTLPIMFVSNIFFPLDAAPGWVERVASCFPLRPLADGLQAGFDPRTAGNGLVGHDLRTLALWSLVGCLLMVRYLRALNRRA